MTGAVGGSFARSPARRHGCGQADSGVHVAFALSEAEGGRRLISLTTRFSSPCGSGTGVGVAFDGAFLWYSCYGSSPDLYKAEVLTGTVVASYTIAGGLGALAWDGFRKMIWAGWGGGFGGDADVHLNNPSTGAAEYISIAGNARHGLPIGLAYDAWNDTLYISDDFENRIYHYQLIGNGVSTTDATLIRSSFRRPSDAQGRRVKAELGAWPSAAVCSSKAPSTAAECGPSIGSTS